MQNDKHEFQYFTANSQDVKSRAVNIQSQNKGIDRKIKLREFLLSKCPEKFDTMESTIHITEDEHRSILIKGMHIDWNIAVQYDSIVIRMRDVDVHIPPSLLIPASVKLLHMTVSTIDNPVHAPLTERVVVKERRRPPAVKYCLLN